MFGLTTLGLFHTAVSLIAVGVGVVSLIRHGSIRWSTQAGKTFVIATAVSCLTALGIFQHGGFGPGHKLAITTLVVLAVAVVAARGAFGTASRYVETLGLSAALFFHMIPGVNETLTRLPPGAPLASSPASPLVQGGIGVFFVVFLIGAALQFRHLRATWPGALASAAT